MIFPKTLLVGLLAAGSVLCGGCHAHSHPSAAGGASANVQSRKCWVYVGTYHSANSPDGGIYLFELDTLAGTLTPHGRAADIEDPHFLAVSPDEQFLYAGASRATTTGHRDSIVASMAINRTTGKLSVLNEQPSGGDGSTFVAVAPDARNVLVANYRSGSIAVLPIAGDGRIEPASCVLTLTGSGPDPSRQKSAHPHSANASPDGRFVFVPDLGTDKIYSYRLDSSKGMLTPDDPASVSTPPGSGPRHFSFHPNGKFAYVIDEMGNTVIAYAYDAAGGALKQLQIVRTLPPDFQGVNTAAEVLVHPNGRFLYASNRGHDSIAIFSVDPETGLLTARGYQPALGKSPRNFRIDPAGRWLIVAHQNSNNIVLFQINPHTGNLTPAGVSLPVPSPVCVKFVTEN